MTRSNQAHVQAPLKVQNTDILAIIMPMINRMKVEEKSDKTIEPKKATRQRSEKVWELPQSSHKLR